MWNLINNELKIFIDPLVFLDLKNLDQRILLINTMKEYSTKIQPNLCFVKFFYKLDSKIDKNRVFLPYDDIIFIKEEPEKVIDIFPVSLNIDEGKVLENIKLNKLFSTALDNKCLFYLSENQFEDKTKIEIEKTYGIKIVNINELYKEIEAFLQGFYNYFKFNLSVYGIDSPDLAYAMSDPFYTQILRDLELKIIMDNTDEELKERVRSFVHNRYIDILVAVDQIKFFKLQQKIFNMERGKIDNKPPLHGCIRYHLNYYLFLLWGAIDHFAWIINDMFSFGYAPNNREHFKLVGLSKYKKKFLEKIKEQDQNLYNFIKSKEFQEWLFLIAELRHKNAHKGIFSASPLLIPTEESEISDEEVDEIIYKEKPVVSKDIEDLMPTDFIENQKKMDRYNYKISKMKIGLEHFASIVKDGQSFLFNPVERIPIDLKMLKKLISKTFDVYKAKIK